MRSDNCVVPLFVLCLWGKTVSRLEKIARCTARSSQVGGSHLMMTRQLKTYMMSQKPSLSLAALRKNAIILCPVATELLFE